MIAGRRALTCVVGAWTAALEAGFGGAEASSALTSPDGIAARPAIVASVTAPIGIAG